MVEILILDYVPFIAFVRYILPIKLKFKSWSNSLKHTKCVSKWGKLQRNTCNLISMHGCDDWIISKAKYKYHEYCLIFLN